MSANSKTSVTTTGMRVGDNEQSRNPIQTDADRNAASGGKQLRNADGTFASVARSKYAGPDGINTYISAEQPSAVRPIRVEQVDHKTLAGSNPGDHRANPGDTAKASLNRAADNGGPRRDPGQFKGSKFETQPATQKYPTPDAGD